MGTGLHSISHVGLFYCGPGLNPKKPMPKPVAIVYEAIEVGGRVRIALHPRWTIANRPLNT